MEEKREAVSVGVVSGQWRVVEFESRDVRVVREVEERAALALREELGERAHRPEQQLAEDL